MTFQEYLIAKKIDAKAFAEAEPVVYQTWEREFSEMHPNSFTMQKLNLINPIRRKYQLAVLPPPPSSPTNPPEANAPAPSTPKPAARPMMKPKPKIN